MRARGDGELVLERGHLPRVALDEAQGNLALLGVRSRRGRVDAALTKSDGGMREIRDQASLSVVHPPILHARAVRSSESLVEQDPSFSVAPVLVEVLLDLLAKTLVRGPRLLLALARAIRDETAARAPFDLTPGVVRRGGGAVVAPHLTAQDTRQAQSGGGLLGGLLHEKKMNLSLRRYGIKT